MSKLDDALKRRIKPGKLFEPETLETKGYSLSEIKLDIKAALGERRLVSFAYGIYYQPSKNGLKPSPLDAIKLRYIGNGNTTYGFFYGQFFIKDYLGQPFDDRQLIEVVTNKATSVKKAVYMFSRRFVIRRSYAPINADNADSLAFLTYLSSASDSEVEANMSVLSTYIRDKHLSSDLLMKFSDKVPSKAYRRLYSTGLYRSLWKR